MEAEPRFSKEERINRLLPVVVPENAMTGKHFTYIRMPQFLHFVADTGG
jgi:hypothetical protein